MGGWDSPDMSGKHAAERDAWQQVGKPKRRSRKRGGVSGAGGGLGHAYSSGGCGSTGGQSSVSPRVVVRGARIVCF